MPNINAAHIHAVRLQDQGSDPASPAAGYKLLYCKAGGIYAINESGTVVGPFTNGITQALADLRYLQISNNLSDVNNAGTSRTNLGLGSAAVENASATPGASIVPISGAGSKLDKDWYPDFVGSGASHAKGAVPDPGAGAGTTKFLREDASWDVPAGTGVSNHDLLDGSVHPDTVAGTVVQGDVIVGNATPKWGRLAKGSDGQVLRMASGAPGWGGVPAGSTPTHAYFTQLAALLEPDALEVPQYDGFSYAIAAAATKYLMLAWYCKFAGNEELTIRDPRFPLPLSNITLNGIGAGSGAMLLDPTKPTYTDAWTTYYDRLEAIRTLKTRYVAFNAASTAYTFLPSAYGILITSVTVGDLPWIGLGSGKSKIDNQSELLWPILAEVSDTTAFRGAHNLLLPMNIHTMNRLVTSGNGAYSHRGIVTYVCLPSTWSKVSDGHTYDFRDDFMGASLNTASTWTRTTTGGGSVEIDTTWQWLKIKGDANWSHNYIISQASVARATGLVFECYVLCPTIQQGLVVGFHDGAGGADSDFAHGLQFNTDGGGGPTHLYVKENGTSRRDESGTIAAGYVYRVRITLQATDTQAKYEIQGGGYATLGGASWTDISPVTSSSSTTPLYAGVTEYSAVDAYVGDIKIYH